MFARRNSATLAAILVVLLAVGGFWYFKDTNKLVAAVKEQTELKITLLKSQEEIKRLTEVETVHERMSNQWKESPKRIMSANEPSFTLAYLNRLMSMNHLDIYYDFVLNSKTEKNDVTRFTFTLTGEGQYDAVNELIWHLTYDPILYQIKSVKLRGGSSDETFRKFNMTLEGYTVARRSESQQNGDVEFPQSTATGYVRQYDIFKPILPLRVVSERKKAPKPTLPAKKPGEIDVTKATLKAVTPTSIFISEGSKPVKQLRIGDTVYLGKLVKIDQRRNQAEFVLTKFGKNQNVILKIDDRN